MANVPCFIRHRRMTTKLEFLMKKMEGQKFSRVRFSTTMLRQFMICRKAKSLAVGLLGASRCGSDSPAYGFGLLAPSITPFLPARIVIATLSLSRVLVLYSPG